MRTPFLTIFSAAFGALACIATAQASEVCDDWWFTRNAIIDRAGYCFKSPLGRAIFDNSDCAGAAVTLSARDKARIEELRRFEKQLGCAVDTSRTTLDIRDLTTRRRLRDLPLRDEFASGCIRRRGDSTPLYSGRNTGTTKTGELRRGDNVLLAFVNVGEWRYLIVGDQSWNYRSAGWSSVPFEQPSCEGWAG